MNLPPSRGKRNCCWSLNRGLIGRESGVRRRVICYGGMMVRGWSSQSMVNRLKGGTRSNRSGGGMIFFRSALVRLVWLATNAPSGCEAMPAGWVHGRMPQIAALDSQPEAHEMLSTLSGGDATSFITWINDRNAKFETLPTIWNSATHRPGNGCDVNSMRHVIADILR